MLAEISVVEKTIEGLNYRDFEQDSQALRVVLYSLAVIGEAVASTIVDLEATESDMPWRKIRGIRNVVIHEYFQVDLEIVWQTTQSDLRILKSALEKILADIDQTKR